MKLTTLIAIILLAAACSSKAPQTAGQAVQRGGEWFCQIAENTEEWQCVQDDELAANPQPQRLPQPPEPEPEPSVAAEPPAEPGVDAQSGDTEALDQSVTQAPPSTVPAQPPQAMPRYAQLAYQPEGPVDLLDLPAEFYAVQLVAVSSKEALEQYAEDHGLRGMAAARVATDDRLFYILLLGVYETRDLAEEAIADVPPPLDELDFWIRSMGSLQQAILAGDALAGTDEV